MLYLAEITNNSKLEPIGITDSLEVAKKMVTDHNPTGSGLVTELELGEVYKEGLGRCMHYHYSYAHGRCLWDDTKEWTEYLDKYIFREETDV